MEEQKKVAIKRRRRARACAITCLLMLRSCGVDSGPPLIAQQTVAAPVFISQRASALQVNETDLIRPGCSVGSLHLGDRRERMLEVLGKKPQDEEYTYGAPCSLTEFHWLDPKMRSNGLFIYLKEDRVFQIASTMPRYRTVEGITVGSPSEDVRRHYPQLRAYVLLGSGMKVVGGRDLIYWVDRQRGIAFEFYYDRKGSMRRVSRVIVFEPSSDFKPEGCISPPQEWRELGPNALEPLGN